MNYSKPPLSIADQIGKLKARGLSFSCENQAAHYLSNISYYRLRAYTYPFQDNGNPDHPFIRPLDFNDIINLYVFDRRLRFIVFNALEKVEIALRTKIVYEMSLIYGSHWHENETLFTNPVFFNMNKEAVEKEINRSKEDFITHYYRNYDNPQHPPCWMSLEVVSMSLLSQIFSNIRELEAKQRILSAFGHKRFDILKSWIHAFVGLRNVCAHHGRLWNRRFTISPTLPYNMPHQFLNNRNIPFNKLYALLCCLNYTLRIVSPGSHFVSSLKEHLRTCPLAELHHMGFPQGWEDEPLWSSQHDFVPLNANH